MKNQKRLTAKQNKVLDDLFKSNKSEIQILKKYDISTSVYRKWFAEDELFAAEFVFRIQAGKRQCELLIANYAPAAAARLIELTQGQKEETTRKACLDVISLPLELTQQKKRASSPKTPTDDISAELAAKILEVLAGDNENV